MALGRTQSHVSVIGAGSVRARVPDSQPFWGSGGTLTAGTPDNPTIQPSLCLSYKWGFCPDTECDTAAGCRVQ